jgi:hypothetical protein
MGFIRQHKMDSVFVFVPVYRLEPETVKAILSLRWDGPVSFNFQRDNPYDGNGKANTLHQYQEGRRRFLESAYDRMLIVESDIIPPEDALIKLYALDADCAYGVYRFRVSNVINIYSRANGPNRNIGESLSLYPDKLSAALRRGVVDCSGAGLGCVLVKRKVMEQIPFRAGDDSSHCDSSFNTDVLRAGYVQKANMSVVCGHKDEHGTILWPDYAS